MVEKRLGRNTQCLCTNKPNNCRLADKISQKYDWKIRIFASHLGNYCCCYMHTGVTALPITTLYLLWMWTLCVWVLQSNFTICLNSPGYLCLV